MSFAYGMSFTYGMSFAKGGEPRVEVFIDVGERSKNEAAVDSLAADKSAIERELGEPLRGERLENRRSCRITCYAPGSIEDSAEQQEQYRKWSIERLLRFKKLFGPRIARLAKRPSAPS